MKHTIDRDSLENQTQTFSLSEKLNALNAKEVLGAFVLFICGFFTVISFQTEALFLKELLVADAIVALMLLIAFLGKTKK